MNAEPTTIIELLQKVAEGHYSTLDMHNLVERFTDHFNADKMELLQEDVESQIREEELRTAERKKNYVKFQSIIRKVKSKKESAVKLVQEDYALLCALDDEDITTYITRPSRKLMQHCNAYKNIRRRTEVLPEMSPVEADNILRRYEKVIPHLRTEEGRKKGNNELEIVRQKINETHFEK